MNSVVVAMVVVGSCFGNLNTDVCRVSSEAYYRQYGLNEYSEKIERDLPESVRTSALVLSAILNRKIYLGYSF